MVSSEDVMALRAKSGAGMLDCRRALELAEGDTDIAYEFLRLLSQPVARYKFRDNAKVSWTTEDYLDEATRYVKKCREMEDLMNDR